MKTKTKYRQGVMQIGLKLFYFHSNLGQNFNDDWPPRKDTHTYKDRIAKIDP